MRARRSKEVNIYSASVVDLFASGLGVFLIVAIIALVNQKKQDAKEVVPGTAENNKVIEALEEKITKLNAEVKNVKRTAMNEKFNSTMSAENKLKEEMELNIQIEKSELEAKYSKIIFNQKKDLRELKDKVEEMKTKEEAYMGSFKALKKQYQSTAGKSSQLKTPKYNFKFELGAKVQLENVQFYAGTDKPIEPYASSEISALATKLLEQPGIKIEVSGHIFLTENEIKKGQRSDDSNLSGKRANTVCNKLINLGITPKRLRCVGYGGTRYLYLTNDQYSKEAQLNRRVEIEVIGK
jgi:flagellar motor protein MotB